MKGNFHAESFTKFFLSWNAHPNATPRVFPVAAGGSHSVEAGNIVEIIREIVRGGINYSREKISE